MQLNPTLKYLTDLARKLDTLEYSLLLLAAECKTLDFNYFKGKVHPDLEYILFVKFSKTKFKRITKHPELLSPIDFVAIDCINAAFGTSLRKSSPSSGDGKDKKPDPA